MSNSFNLDLVVECVKTLVDCNRCVICDKLEGSFRRHTRCGHTVCENCVEGTSGAQCLLCLTPPESDNPSQAQPDPVITQRVRKVSELLNACEESFGVDVYKRQRISEQLKVERELFPQCIQAPLTYSNKRKSMKTPIKEKENNDPIFLGESISPIKRINMEDTFNYVHQWLDQNGKKAPESPQRRPLGDLKVNQIHSPSKHSTPLKRKVASVMEKAPKNKKSKIKSPRKSIKSVKSVVNSQHLLDKYWKPKTEKSLREDSLGWNAKRFKREFDKYDKGVKKNENDESGIVVDDEPIVIDDSQSQLIDKDQQAWLAVLEAEKNDPYIATPSIRLENSQNQKYINVVESMEHNLASTPKKAVIALNKVPFYKKSYLIETCDLCKNNYLIEKPSASAGQNKDVNITIESNSFITTINLTTVKDKPKVLGKQSISVQTDITNMDCHSKTSVVENKELVSCSQDVFTVENIIEVPIQVKSNTVADDLEKEQMEVQPFVVADSDSDDALESSASTMQVTAEVHRSSDQMDLGVLSEIGDLELQHRTRPSKRGYSPSSSNSSEKENFDPNKRKRLKLGKKEIDKKSSRKLDLSAIKSNI